ncbi:MAG: hypothetical protein HY275_15200 [Gemmatimonadetes bacterium]|nr:hypothetical protein [Gemmatimonadota bacterium]
MSDAAIFIGVFGGLFVARFIAATIVFVVLLPEGDRCPVCDGPTLRVAHPVWNRVAPFFRTSWCHGCGWEGMLRHGKVRPSDRARSLTSTRNVTR